jgi:hypothetical protein
MKIKNFKLICPTEENGYNVFESHLEEDNRIFFHMTPARNKDDIINNGFRSAKKLGVGELESVSYAKRSSYCFANIKRDPQSEFVIFAVKFELDDLNRVKDNPSDIHVYIDDIQPKILGFVYIPSGFKVS